MWLWSVRLSIQWQRHFAFGEIAMVKCHVMMSAQRTNDTDLVLRFTMMVKQFPNSNRTESVERQMAFSIFRYFLFDNFECLLCDYESLLWPTNSYVIFFDVIFCFCFTFLKIDKFLSIRLAHLGRFSFVRFLRCPCTEFFFKVFANVINFEQFLPFNSRFG